MIKMGNKLSISEEGASQRALLDYRIDNGTLVEPRSVVVIKNGELIINEQIPVAVAEYNIYMRVDIMWEDAGYSNYRDLGLYGYYSTSYVPMSYCDGELRIKPTDINIEIVIK